MNLKSKHIAALLAASALSFGLPASAQPGQGGMVPGPAMGPGAGPGACPGYSGQWKGNPRTWLDQRLAQFKSQLKITPQQEPLWNAFAEKAKSGVGPDWAKWQEMRKAKTAPERMDLMVEHMKQRIATMEGVNDSFKRLYDALTPEQKAVADKYDPFGGRAGARRGGPRGRVPQQQQAPGAGTPAG